jgi:1-acyl-sn-glycerol-3-phosphate acyltransferase
VNFRVFFIFLKTAYFALLLISKKNSKKKVVLRRWGEMVLKGLGYQLVVLGSAPKQKSCILVGNHISYLDIPVLMACLPKVIFIAKDDLRRWPIIGLGAAAAGTLFVSRQSGGDRSGVKAQISEYLKKEDSNLVVFPSGTTSLFEEVPWKKGIFEIAKQTNTTIQLFRIDYTPLRESAYIDDDNLIEQISGTFNIKNKKVVLTWLGQFEEVDDPLIFSKKLREKVASKVKHL